LEEVTLDAGREGFCDKELGQSKLTHIKLNETVDGLTASFEGGRSQITQLTQDVAWLNQELSDLAASLKVATDMRVAERAKPTRTGARSMQLSRRPPSRTCASASPACRRASRARLRVTGTNLVSSAKARHLRSTPATPRRGTTMVPSAGARSAARPTPMRSATARHAT